MNVILVDDERLARRELQYLLSGYDDLNIKGDFRDVDSALDFIKKHRPDLIFLDINMPEKDGFDLLEEIEDETIQVIFTTAYDQYAIKAFEHHALDYLLKPINSERLEQSLKRARKTLELLNRENQLAELGNMLHIMSDDVSYDLHIRDIDLLESYGNYVKIHFGDQKLLHHISLRNLEQQLRGHHFFRANRFTLVPIHKIREVNRYSKSRISFDMENGSKVICSERKTVAYRRMIKKK